jgi:hypothetical protein
MAARSRSVASRVSAKILVDHLEDHPVIHSRTLDRNVIVRDILLHLLRIALQRIAVTAAARRGPAEQVARLQRYV